MKLKKTYPFLFVFSFTLLHSFEKVTYQFLREPIDVVIPCHSKDAESLNRTIESIKKYVQGMRRIITISSQPFTDQAEWINENNFPFSKESIALEIFKPEEVAYKQIYSPKSRMGWIYQQFLKLFALYYIPGISSNVLIVDADVVFLKPIIFIQENGAGLYAVGGEFHAPYFDHAARLFPGLKKLYSSYSGIAHHMLLQKPVLDDLFDLIGKQHGVEPWRAIARTIPVDNQNEINTSVMSEYEIYFNFVFARTNQVKIRHLKWQNISYGSQIPHFKARGYDYVAVHVRNP